MVMVDSWFWVMVEVVENVLLVREVVFFELLCLLFEIGVIFIVIGVLRGLFLIVSLLMDFWSLVWMVFMVEWFEVFVGFLLMVLEIKDDVELCFWSFLFGVG